MKRSVVMVGLAAVVLAAPFAVNAQQERQGRAGQRGQPADRAAQRAERLAAVGQQTPRGGGAPATYRAGFAPAPAVAASSVPATNAALAPATTSSDGAPAKPGPVDPLANLGRKVSAVLDISTEPRLLVTETEYGVSDTSELTLGQEYRDGWRLAAVNPGSITMKKGEDSRQIALNFNTGAARGPVAAPPPANLAGVAAAAQAATGRGGVVSLSNGGGQAGAGRGGNPAVGAGMDPAQMQALARQFGVNIDPSQFAALAQLGANIDPAQVTSLTNQLRDVLANGGGAPGGAAAAFLGTAIQGAFQGQGGGAPPTVFFRAAPGGAPPAPAP